ncbi:hypothetical protein ABIA28_005140 [Bradyrhizobium elkanii]
MLVEIVEPGLAERHDLRMLGQLDQFAGRDAILFIGMMWMGADRAVDVGEALGDREQAAEPPHPGRDRDHAADAGRLRAADDPVEIVGKVGKIQMAVTVDQHEFRTTHSVFGST